MRKGGQALTDTHTDRYARSSRQMCVGSCLPLLLSPPSLLVVVVVVVRMVRQSYMRMMVVC